MRLSRGALAATMVLLLSDGMAAQEREDAAVSVRLTPAATFPLADDADAFTLGGATGIMARLEVFRFLHIEGGVQFSLVPIDVKAKATIDKANLILLEPHVGVASDWQILPRLTLGGSVAAGYYYATIPNVDAETTTGQNPAVSAGAGVFYRVARALSLGVVASYRNFVGLYNDATVGVSTTYHFASRKAGATGPRPLKDLEMGKVALDPVFPVFYKYYNDKPIGRITLTNGGRIPLEDVKVSSFVARYMDNPTPSPSVAFVKGGQSIEVDLLALFNNRVLEISEGDLVQLSIAVECTVAGEEYRNELVQSLRMYDRNATTWADDRRAAAFVTTKDPAVLQFSKSVSSMIGDSGRAGINENLLKAIAFHEALAGYGMTYVVDPASSYVQLSANKSAIDYLQFPSQTLRFKAGDCDDLSILNCALLESVAVETAFVTVPGHIFVAFSLDMSPAQARAWFSSVDDLIFRDGKTWVPVEVTAIGGGFLKAWAAGASQWRENAPRNLAGFFPVREAWKTYEPVGYGGEGATAEPPVRDRVMPGFERETERFIRRELDPRVAELQRLIRDSQNDARQVNRLAILYARFGRYDEALDQLAGILRSRPFVPAMVNSGNIYLLKRDPRRALELFARAAEQSPSDASVLLGLARAYYELERHEESAESYRELKRLNPTLAQTYSYLEGARPASGDRAAEASSRLKTMSWEGE